MSTTKQLFDKILSRANVEINGNRSWDIIVHNENFFDRVAQKSILGLGESYMDKWWDSPKLDEFFYRLLQADLDICFWQLLFKEKDLFLVGLKSFWHQTKTFFYNYQTKARAFEVGKVHYDLGNDLFAAMLDKELNYTCGYWKNTDNLDAAQIEKCRLVCDKLHLRPGQKILDIGCGWGSFARFAAKNYGVSVVGLTISKQQKARADELSQGLPIEIRLQDYRDINEKFDHIISLGMFEHVGYKNYRTYMQIAHRCLNDQGLFLLHTIGTNRTSYNVNAWTDKYIFPNGMLPSIRQIGKAIEPFFVMEDWHNFGAFYDYTLMAWHKNFNHHWSELKKHYDERFKRMWDYYLLSCAGAFRARKLQLWQIVLCKKGCVGGYESIR